MVDKYKIQGGNQLKGEVLIGGAKNSVLKLMASAVLAKGETKIYNVPELTDVGIMLEVINGLGIKTNHDKKEQSVTIDATDITSIIFIWCCRNYSTIFLTSYLRNCCK